MNRPAAVLSAGLSVLVLLSLVLTTVLLVRRPQPASASSRQAAPSQRLPLPAKRPGVGLVTIYGPIDIEAVSEFGSAETASSDEIVDLLDEFGNDPAIRAVVLRINSPGGTIGSAQEIVEKIGRLREKGVVVVASMADICASGGYYIACAADRIVANPGTLTGSIGVIVSGVELSDLMRKLGVRDITVKSGPLKDLLSPYRPPTAEELRLVQEVVDASYEDFLRTVSEHRKIPLEKLRPIADGRIFTGRQALALGLVDELGGLETAIRAAGKLAELGESPPVYERRRRRWVDLLLEEIGVRSGAALPFGLRRHRAPVRYEFAF